MLDIATGFTSKDSFDLTSQITRPLPCIKESSISWFQLQPQPQPCTRSLVRTTARLAKQLAHMHKHTHTHLTSMCTLTQVHAPAAQSRCVPSGACCWGGAQRARPAAAAAWPPRALWLHHLGKDLGSHEQQHTLAVLPHTLQLGHEQKCRGCSLASALTLQPVHKQKRRCCSRRSCSLVYILTQHARGHVYKQSSQYTPPSVRMYNTYHLQSSPSV